jgi:post-segregation antitoxin (ccd killing protein)
MTNQTNVGIPHDLRDKARKLGINISKVARDALAVEVERIEHELAATVGS